MTTFAVYTPRDIPAPDDGPFDVDADTRVELNDNDIIIRQVKRSAVSSRVLGYNFVRVADVAALYRALVQADLVQAERRLHDDRPMLDDQRRAIFAGLREVYGPLSRQRRLGIISAIVGRLVESLSTGPNVPAPLTRAEASHVLDVLNA